MNLPYLTRENLLTFIDSSLREDIGEGDHSTLAAIPEATEGSANLLIKSDGILAGVELAREFFSRFDPALQLHAFKHDGDRMAAGEIGFRITGRVRSILSTERVVLNCMQRMSGIATYTRRLAALLEGTTAQLIDTRKTTPNFRLAEKWAVAIGGGKNHRYALSDMILLKDNHVDSAGGIVPAMRRAKAYLGAHDKKLAIEVETRTIDEVGQALGEGGIDVIMLDNMDLPTMTQAVRLIGGRCKTEASGGITEANLRSVALCGVDYVSVGALTHSAKSLDLSLKIERPGR